MRILEVMEVKKEDKILDNRLEIEVMGIKNKGVAYINYMSYLRNYSKIFKLLVEHDDGVIENVLFGYENGVTIVSGDSLYLEKEHIKRDILRFCERYKQDIQAGKDIEKIVLDDGVNIFNFEPRRCGKSRPKTLSRTLWKRFQRK